MEKSVPLGGLLFSECAAWGRAKGANKSRVMNLLTSRVFAKHV